MSFPPETSEPVLPESETVSEEEEPVLPESETVSEEEEPLSEGKIIAPVLRERPVTLDKVKSSPTIVTGLVILIIIALLFAVRSVSGFLGGAPASPAITKAPTPTTASSAGAANLPTDQGLSFTPRTVSCESPTIFAMAITLPATLAATDTVVEKLDGKTLATSLVVSNLGLTQQADGSWKGSLPSTAASMQTTCANKGINTAGQAILTTGNHTLQLLDGKGNILAQGSYIVTTGPLNYSTTIPTPPPSQVVIAGGEKITFAPAALDCKAPTAFATTITLSGAFSSTEVLTENFNGQPVSSFAVGQVMDQLTDGSWTTTNTISPDQVKQICADSGKYNGVAVFAAGPNDLQLLNSQGKVIAENSYTVK